MRRFTPIRESFIPAKAVKVADKLSDAVAYLYTNPGNGLPAARVFVGKQAKPIIAYYYSNEARREAAVLNVFKARRARLASKAGDRAKVRAFVNPYTVGDLFHSSWGYDQTNVNYYEVVSVAGKMMTVREIAQVSVDTGSMCGKTAPQVGQFTGPEIRCRAQDGRIKVNHHRHAYFLKPESTVAGVKVYGSSYFSNYA